MLLFWERPQEKWLFREEVTEACASCSGLREAPAVEEGPGRASGTQPCPGDAAPAPHTQALPGRPPPRPDPPQDSHPALSGPCHLRLCGVTSFWCFSAQNKVRILPEPSICISLLSYRLGQAWLVRHAAWGVQARETCDSIPGLSLLLAPSGEMETSCLSDHWCCLHVVASAFA